ncbi:DUF6507 family protein [Myceligenerans crystallogenes]|uniref:ESX-1 secretion-associated protein n=1 Tax=Myceligenerans crystallogenes TaxID=316335 RepID=A0ABN2N8L0_9MICO
MSGTDGWELDPAAIQRTLQGTLTDGENLDATLAKPQETHEKVAAASPGAVPVLAALTGFFEARGRLRDDVRERVQAGVTGAATALHWYQQGDEEMAATQQALARRAASSGDLDVFQLPPGAG